MSDFEEEDVVQEENGSSGLFKPLETIPGATANRDQMAELHQLICIALSARIRAGILNGALLVVDASLSPCDGSLLVCTDSGEFRIKRYRTHPEPHLENLENGRKEFLRIKDEMADSDRPVFGVITYIINDARSGEFDDCPVM